MNPSVLRRLSEVLAKDERRSSTTDRAGLSLRPAEARAT
jgi:hypothetical protein